MLSTGYLIRVKGAAYSKFVPTYSTSTCKGAFTNYVTLEVGWGGLRKTKRYTSRGERGEGVGQNVTSRGGAGGEGSRARRRRKNQYRTS